MKRGAKKREHHHVLATVAKRGETNDQVMMFIMDKTLKHILLTKSVHIVLMELHHHTVEMPSCNNCAYGEHVLW